MFPAVLNSCLNMNLKIKTDMVNPNFHVRVPIYVKDNHVSTPSIPFLYPDGYSITLNQMQIFGGIEQPNFAWTVQKGRASILLYINNGDAAYYFGDLYPGNLWDLYFMVTEKLEADWQSPSLDLLMWLYKYFHHR